MRYLNKRLESAVLADPKQQLALRQVFFGATVTYARADGSERTATLVGVDESDLSQARSAGCRPSHRRRSGQKSTTACSCARPSGVESIEIVAIRYGSDAM